MLGPPLYRLSDAERLPALRLVLDGKKEKIGSSASQGGGSSSTFPSQRSVVRS